MANKQNQLNAMLSILAFTLTAGLYSFISKYAVDFPLWDDASDILIALTDIHNANSASEVLGVIFGQHTAHITAFNKLVALAYQKLFGELNFRHLIFIGNSLIIVFAAQLAWLLRKAPNFHWAAAIVMVMLLHPNAWVSHTWATASLQNFGVWVFGFAAIQLIYNNTNSTPHLVAAIALASVASFTQGNGVLVLPIMAAISVQRGEKPYFRYGPAFACLLLMLIYFELVSVSEGRIATLRHESISMLINQPHLAILHCTSILGTYFSRHVSWAAAAGVIGVSYLVVRFLSCVRKEIPLSIWLLVFITLSVVAITASRLVMQSGSQAVEVVRYYYYSQIFWTVIFADIYLFASQRWSSSRLVSVLLVTTLGSGFLLWTHTASSLRDAGVRHAVQWTLTQKLLLKQPGLEAQDKESIYITGFRSVLSAARAAEIYDPGNALIVEEGVIYNGNEVCRFGSLETKDKGNIVQNKTQLPGVARLKIYVPEVLLPVPGRLVVCYGDGAKIFSIPLKNNIVSDRYIPGLDTFPLPAIVLLANNPELEKAEHIYFTTGKKTVFTLSQK